MENMEIRMEVMQSGITYKRLAKEMGISREWLSRLMSRPLSKENRLKLVDALARIQTDKGGGRE